MEREILEELACDRLVELIDQAAWHQNHDNEVDKLLCLAEAQGVERRYEQGRGSPLHDLLPLSE